MGDSSSWRARERISGTWRLEPHSRAIFDDNWFEVKQQRSDAGKEGARHGLQLALAHIDYRREIRFVF